MQTPWGDYAVSVASLMAPFVRFPQAALALSLELRQACYVVPHTFRTALRTGRMTGLSEDELIAAADDETLSMMEPELDDEENEEDEEDEEDDEEGD